MTHGLGDQEASVTMTSIPPPRVTVTAASLGNGGGGGRGGVIQQIRHWGQDRKSTSQG